MIIDSHSHLYSSQFDTDREEDIQRANMQGVQKILLPNIDTASISPMLDLCNEYPNIFYPMMGLHPCSVDQNFEANLQTVWEKLNTKKIIAIGEIGIDLYWDKSTLDLQIEAFRVQVAWAKKLSLPIVIHARDSFDELFKELDDLNDDDLTGVFHCFTGTIEQANKVLAYGNFYLGIGGVVTFKKSGLDMVLKELPINKLLVETDSPYLAPMPFRGKRNESAYTSIVVDKIAEIYRLPKDEVAQQLTANTYSLFKRLAQE